MTWLYKSFANIVKGLSFPSPSSAWPRYWFLYQNGFIRLPITPWFMARLCPCHECRHQTPATPSYSKDAQSYQLLLWVLSWIPSRYRKAWIWRILWCNEQGMGRDISTTTWYDRSNSSIECITRWTYFGSRRVWTTTCLEWSSRSCIESRAIKVVKWILVPQTNAKSASIFSFSFFHSLSLSFGSIQVVSFLSPWVALRVWHWLPWPSRHSLYNKRWVLLNKLVKVSWYGNDILVDQIVDRCDILGIDVLYPKDGSSFSRSEQETVYLILGKYQKLYWRWH